jgi:hypothetical protein
MPQNSRASNERPRQDDWIRRVLGVQCAREEKSAKGPPHGAPSQSGSDPVGIWWDTKDRLNEQLEKLRHAFMNTEHPLAGAACEAGLGAFSAGILVRFQAALIDFNTADDRDREARVEKVRQLGGELGNFVATNDMLPLLEANPFGVSVTVRADVLSAIERIVQELGRSASAGRRHGS